MIRLRLLGLLLCLSTACASSSQPPGDHPSKRSIARERKNCWQEGQAPTLLTVMESAMRTPLEADMNRDNYIQTFGCAYEEVDIEKNAIQAVYRAILQSLKNRGVTARDELLALLRSSPPRPDNLVREYTIYVHLPANGATDGHVAPYQVRILQLEVVHTVESPVAIWTRVATRFSHREDHYRALPQRDEKSDFVRVLRKAQRVLELVQKGKGEEVLQLFPEARAQRVLLRKGLQDLVFGDRLRLVDQKYPRRYFPAIFLGKGLLFGVSPRGKTVVFKFGEERLWGLRLDFRTVLRADSDFESFGYKAPETILQCLFLKSKKRKQKLTVLP